MADVQIFDSDKDGIVAYVAQLIATIKLLSETRSYITIALSGGSLINHLTNELIKQKSLLEPFIPKLRFILADERFVDYDNNDSTYGCYVKLDFFKQLNIDQANVFPIKTDAKSVEECAIDYEQRIRPLLNENNGFDILSLGMGPDGHMCSLFPGHDLFLNANNDNRIVAHISDSPKPPPSRVTLTLNCINKSSHVMFFCTGEGKAQVIKRIIKDNDTSLPSGAIQLTNGSLKWFLDKPAAKLL
jgi:6-phosphogluconolactonase